MLEPQKVVYQQGEFSLNLLKETFQQLYNNPPPQRRVTLFTGATGHLLFNLAIQFGEYAPDIPYWVYIPKRGVKNKFIELSLWTKHSLYKVRVYEDILGDGTKKRFHFYYGTELLFKSHTIADYKQYWLSYGLTAGQTPYRKKEVRVQRGLWTR